MTRKRSAPAATVEIRPLARADLSRVVEIYAHHVLHGTATFETTPPSRAEMQRRVNDVLERGLTWFVAEIGGEVVGYGYAGLYRSRPAYRYTVEDSIYLDPAVTGCGVGTRLLEAIVRDCETAGCRQIVAVIGDSANAASIGVHRKLGFEHVGVIRDVGYKFGRWLDTVIMQLALGGGATSAPDAAARVGSRKV